MIHRFAQPPSQPVTLRFRDTEFERLFQRERHRYRLDHTRRALLGAISVLLATSAAYYILIGELSAVVTFMLGGIVPLLAVGFVCTFVMPRSVDALMWGVAVTALLGCATTVGIHGAASVYPITGTFVPLLLFSTIVLVPGALAVVIITAVAVSAFVGALLYVNTPAALATTAATTALLSGILAVYQAYVRETRERRLFAQSTLLELLAKDSDQRQQEHISWLRMIPAYLETDLRQHLFALETDLDQMSGTASAADTVDEATHEFRFETMRQHVSKMLNIFETARTATDMPQTGPGGPPINLSLVTRDVVLRRSRALADAHMINVDTEQDVWTRGEQAPLTQAIDHIFTGATLHIEPEVTLHARVRPEDDVAVLELDVDREFIALASAALLQQPGVLGLNLFLASRLIELLGGRFEVLTTPGHTCFRATLPLHEHASTAPSASAQTQPHI